ncbi:MAG: succinate dehydrogenase, hydrophobic membrane anchor protein [Burkholderiaceae bacterium]|nr:MAG: succinate dehydrogenase, hydrophobic membrane anchor protein [Burkholderiaceae bacterium]TAM07583.1 MAG: succinate dehydrogenase, hydrophobic membrane anchor protein [Pusillimonas sp.]
MSAYPGQDSLRTPLKVARRFGSSKSGVHHWWLQRLTAIALTPLSIWLLFFLGALMHVDYQTVLTSIAQPVHAILHTLYTQALRQYSKRQTTPQVWPRCHAHQVA